MEKEGKKCSQLLIRSEKIVELPWLSWRLPQCVPSNVQTVWKGRNKNYGIEVNSNQKQN